MSRTQCLNADSAVDKPVIMDVDSDVAFIHDDRKAGNPR